MSRVILLLSLMLFAGIAFTTNQQDSSSRHDEVSTRGDHVMGFSHDAASHHFRLFKDGGEIEVQSDADGSGHPRFDDGQVSRAHRHHVFCWKLQCSDANSRYKPAGRSDDDAL